MKDLVKKSIWIITAYGFWTFLYPEFCVEEGLYKAYYVSDNHKIEAMDEEIYEQLMEAESGQIVIKSKLLEKIRKTFEKR